MQRDLHLGLTCSWVGGLTVKAMNLKPPYHQCLGLWESSRLEDEAGAWTGSMDLTCLHGHCGSVSWEDEQQKQTHRHTTFRLSTDADGSVLVYPWTHWNVTRNHKPATAMSSFQVYLLYCCRLVGIETNCRPTSSGILVVAALFKGLLVVMGWYQHWDNDGKTYK